MRFFTACLSLILLVCTACNSKKTLFTKLEASATGIEFNNE